MWFHFGTCPLGTREILGPPTTFADFLLSFPRNTGLCGLQSPEKLQVLLREHPQPWWVCFLPLCFLQGLWVCKWPSLPDSLCGTVVLLGHLQYLTIPYLSLSLWSWKAEGGKKLGIRWLKFQIRHVGEEDTGKSEDPSFQWSRKFSCKRQCLNLAWKFIEFRRMRGVCISAKGRARTEERMREEFIHQREGKLDAWCFRCPAGGLGLWNWQRSLYTTEIGKGYAGGSLSQGWLLIIHQHILWWEGSLI